MAASTQGVAHRCAFPERIASPNTHVIDFDFATETECFAALQRFIDTVHEELAIGSCCRSLVMGCDMEWTTRMVAPTGSPGSRCASPASPGQSSDGSPRSRSRRETGKVAVMQLCTAGAALVLRSERLLSLGGEAESLRGRPECEQLVALLRDPRIFKVGVGIAGDKAKLAEDYGVELEPTVDLVCLRDAATSVTQLEKKGFVASLKNLSAAVLGVELTKVKSITISDWGDRSVPLTQQQIEYALDDVCASLELANAMIANWCSLEGVGVSDAANDANTGGGAGASQEVRERLLQPLVGKQPSTGGARRGGGGGGDAHKVKGAKPVPATMPGQGWFTGRQSRYYDNIRVLGPDGQLYFTVDINKAQWYLKKGLASVSKLREDASPTVAQGEKDSDDGGCGGCGCIASSTLGDLEEIQLDFTPNFGRYGDEHLHRDLEYFRAPKENKCVVCGSERSLVRHSIVPTAYRKFMPPAYVSHNSYDMLLVCVACFPRLTFFCDKERNAVAEEFGFPLSVRCAAAAAGSGGAGDGEEGPTGFSDDAKHAAEQRQIIHELIKFASALHRVRIVGSADPSQGPSKDGPKLTRKLAGIPLERVAQMEDFVKQHAPLYVYPPLAKKKKKAASKPKAKQQGPSATEAVAGPSTAPESPGENADHMVQAPCTIDPANPLSAESLAVIMIADPWRVAAASAAAAAEQGAPSGEEEGARESEPTHSLPQEREAGKNGENAAREQCGLGESTSSSSSSLSPLVRSHAARIPKVLPAAQTHAMHVIQRLIASGEQRDAAEGRPLINGVEVSHVDLNISTFVLRWRAHFFRHMNPMHMPRHWRIDSGIIVHPHTLVAMIEGLPQSASLD